jgi:hypothetical protein
MRISFSRRANPVPDLRGVACGFTCGLGLNLSFDLIIFVMGGSWQPAIKSKRNPNFRELTQSVQRWGRIGNTFPISKYLSRLIFTSILIIYFIKKLKFEKIKYNFTFFK